MLKATLTERARADSTNATLVIGANSFEGYDTNGGLTQFRRAGTQTSAEFYADKGVIGIARWSGGSGILGSERGPTQGDHYVFGTRATNLPTAGLFTFDLLTYTQPTIRNVATTQAGSVTSAHASVRYVNSLPTGLGLDFTVNVNGSSYVVRSPGGLNSPSIGFAGGNGGVVSSSNPFSITGGTGPACPGTTCNAQVSAFLAGSGATNLGVVYSIYSVTSPTTNTVDGALLFGNPTRPTQTVTGAYNQTFPTVTLAAASAQGSSNSFGLARLSDGSDVRSASMGSADPGTFTSFTGNAGAGDFTVTRGSGVSNPGGAFGRLGWIRWGAATLSGAGSAGLSASQGVHAIWGAPLTGTAPTGRATYVLLGGTQPTVGGSTGAFAGALVVDFATSLVGWDSVLTIGSEKINFFSDGGTSAPSITLGALADGRRTFSGSGTVAAQSGACGGCTGSAVGFVSGADASEAGFSYALNTYLGTIAGVAGFQREGGTQWTSGAPTEPPQYVVSTGTRTILQGSATTIAANNDGTATGFNGPAAASKSSGADNFDNGGVAGVLGWTRWGDGQVNHDGNLSYSDRAGVHVIWGTPTANIPTTGTATYTLAGSTKPTHSGGAQATGVFTGSVGVDFAAMKVGWTTNINMSGQNYGFSSTGGAAAPSVTLTSTGTFAASGTVTTPSGGSSFGAGYGFLAGPAASHLGFGYRINPVSNQNDVITGVAAFTRN